MLKIVLDSFSMDDCVPSSEEERCSRGIRTVDEVFEEECVTPKIRGGKSGRREEVSRREDERRGLGKGEGTTSRSSLRWCWRSQAPSQQSSS